MTARRFVSLDLARGIAIMIIVVIHRVHYTWTGMQDSTTLQQYFAGPLAPLVILTIALFTMAGVFYLVSGTVNALAMHARIADRKQSAGWVVLGGVVTGLWLIAVNYVQRLLFMNGFAFGPGGAEPEFPVGLLTGLVSTGTPTPFRWSQVTEPGTLSLIGLIVIILSLVFGLLLRNEGWRNASRNTAVLLALGAVSLLASPVLKFWLMPYYTAAYASGNYAAALLLGHLCQEFSLCPYLGYGFLGAVVGLALARGESLREIRRRSNWVSLALMIVGALALVLFNRRSPLGSRAMGAGISYIELAIFLFVMGLLLKGWDFGDEAQVARRRRSLLIVQRFGIAALSVYVLEPFLAAAGKALVDALIGPAWSTNLLAVIAFGLVCLLVWSGLLALWARVGFAGSVEWLSVRVLRVLAHKESGKIATLAMARSRS